MSLRIYFLTLAIISLILSVILSINAHIYCSQLYSDLKIQQNLIIGLQEQLKYISSNISKVENVNEKQQLIIDDILQQKTDTEQNGRLTNLESYQQSETNNTKNNYEQINQLKSEFQVLNTKVEGIQKNSDLINNSFTLTYLDRELESMKNKHQLTNNQQNEQFNEIKSNFTTISNNMQKLSELSNSMNSLSVIIDSLTQQVPNLNKMVSALDLKINSETFNKVEIRGPYYAKHHQNLIPLRKNEYTVYSTDKPCILNIKGKAVVELTAIGISLSPNCEAQMTFLVNRKPQNEIFSDLSGGIWAYNQYTIVISTLWRTLAFTQVIILENQENCEISLGIKQTNGTKNILTLNGLSFVVKISYIF